jgi:hypothetical protein
LDSGENRFAVKRLTRKIFETCTFPLLKILGNDDVILYYSFPDMNMNSIKTDTLIYKFGDFVNYHSSGANYRIQKIEFSTDACMRQCPQFKITIDSNRIARYDAINYNTKYGAFKGSIKAVDYEQLTQLLCYLDFPGLKDNYSGKLAIRSELHLNDHI